MVYTRHMRTSVTVLAVSVVVGVAGVVCTEKSSGAGDVTDLGHSAHRR